MGLEKIFVLILYSGMLNCQPGFRNKNTNLLNNSYIFYTAIYSGASSLKCVSERVICWKDENEREIHPGENGTMCLYSITKGEEEISLNRNDDCIPETSGLWRCDIRNSSEKIHSLYIYISSDELYGEIAKIPHNSKSLSYIYRAIKPLSDYELYSTH